MVDVFAIGEVELLAGLEVVFYDGLELEVFGDEIAAGAEAGLAGVEVKATGTEVRWEKIAELLSPPLINTTTPLR